MQTKRKWLLIVFIVLGCLGATVVASTQISLDSPATLPSDI
jgi:hypothetical protein